MSERRRIGLREVRALQPDTVIWDAAVTGFGARRRQTEAVWYLVKYRTADGRQRWQTIGRHGAPWTPDAARTEARRILGEVAHGGDPAGAKRAQRAAKTIAELCDAYLADAEAGRLLTRRGQSKKPSTLATDRGRIERHIKPLLGRLTVAAVTRDDIEGFMHAVAEGETAGRIKTGRHGLARVAGGKGTATRTLGLIGAIFAYAVRHRMRADNPAHGIVRYADGRRERRLSDAEYAALGRGVARGRGGGNVAAGDRRGALPCSHRLAQRRGAGLAPGRDRPCPAHGAARRHQDRAIASAAVACGVRRARAACRASAGDRIFPPTRGTAGTLLHLKKFWPRIARLGRSCRPM